MNMSKRGKKKFYASASEITPCNKIDKTACGLQIYGRRYDVHNNVAYIMTQLKLLRQKLDFKVILMSYDK